MDFIYASTKTTSFVPKIYNTNTEDETVFPSGWVQTDVPSFADSTLTFSWVCALGEEGDKHFVPYLVGVFEHIRIFLIRIFKDNV